MIIIIAGIDLLLDQSICFVKAGLRAKLSEIGVDVGDLPGVEEVFSKLHRPFSGLETAFKQEKYYKDSFSLLVCIGHYCK